MFFISNLMSQNIGIVVNGVMAAKYGWPSFFWLSLATACFTQIVMIFGLPETKYVRVAETSARCIMTTAGAGEDTLHSDSVLYKGYRSRQAFGVFPAQDKSMSVRRYFHNCLKLLTSPIILWGAFSFAFVGGSLLAVVIIQSQLFAFPPYNFSSYSVGLTNFSSAISNAIGALAGGWICDWHSSSSARKNNGIQEAEIRLPSLISFSIVYIVGMILYAIGARDGYSWPLVVVLGLGLSGIGVGGVIPIVTAYVVDAYKEWTGEYLLIATLTKESDYERNLTTLKLP